MKSRYLDELRVARLKKRVEEFCATRQRYMPNKELPRLVRDAIASCALIVLERERFPELGSGKGQQRFLFTQPDRERHLLHLLGVSLVLMCLLSHMDLATRRAGRRRRDGSCDAIRACKPYGKREWKRPFKQTTIQAETGLGRSAVEAALRTLRDAEFIESWYRSKKYDDKETGDEKYRGFPAIHVVTMKCLERLGIDEKDFTEQSELAKKRQVEGPDPIVDVKQLREHRRVVRQTQVAAKRAREAVEKLVKGQQEREERLFGKKLE